MCPTPFAYLFIGYDGQYYLCCSDWKKEVPLGSVADTSFTDVMVAKLAHARTRQPVCKTCNLDPLNKLTEALRARDAGEADAPDVDALIEHIQNMTDVLAREKSTALTGQPAPAAERLRPPPGAAPSRVTAI